MAVPFEINDQTSKRVGGESLRGFWLQICFELGALAAVGRLLGAKRAAAGRRVPTMTSRRTVGASIDIKRPGPFRGSRVCRTYGIT
jgi:hypothetical protein